MLQRPARLLWLLLIAGSALTPVLFRCFITLDGPMHVLHACALKAAWFSGRYDTTDVTYSAAGRADPTDLAVLPFTILLSPEGAHTAYAVVCLLVLGFGMFRLVRSYAPQGMPLLLWVLPLSWNFALILGFLPFLLTVGCVLLVFAWWLRQTRIGWRNGLVLLLCAVVLQWMHRIGGVLIATLVACHEGVAWLADPRSNRWPSLPRWSVAAGLMTIGGAVLYKIVTTAYADPLVATPAPTSFWQGLFDLRPMLLLSQPHELPYLHGFGLLMIMSMVAAIHARWRSWAGWADQDALWVAAGLLIVASVVIRSPNALLLYLPMRAQAIALMLLMLWTAVVVASPKLVWGIGLLLLPLHVHRLIYLEERMSATRAAIDQAQEVVERLPEHGVALNFVRDDNWLHEHLGAFAACSYRGVFFSPNEHLRFTYREKPSIHLDRYSRGFQQELAWLAQHIASGAPPVIDHVVLFGHGAPPDPRQQNLVHVLEEHYFRQWKNDYAEVWALRPNK